MPEPSTYNPSAIDFLIIDILKTCLSVGYGDCFNTEDVPGAIVSLVPSPQSITRDLVVLFCVKSLGLLYEIFVKSIVNIVALALSAFLAAANASFCSLGSIIGFNGVISSSF
ncbi:MAG: hypothetical protein ACRCSG_05060 [Cellulosilyticaceae bacterium]